jgi:hypothetical protein
MGAGANVFVNGGASLSVMNSDVSAGTVVGGSGGIAGTGQGSGFYLHQDTSSSVHVGAAQTRSISGVIAGDGTLTKTGSGSLILTSANTFNVSSIPTVQVLEGRLIVNNTSGSGTGAARVAVLAAAALAGNGHIAGATTIHAGARLEAGDGLGILGFGGALSLESSATTAFQLGGNLRGAEYDSLSIGGTLQLGGLLDVSLVNGFAASAGEEFLLIDKLSTNAITGTFAGLAEGAIFSAAGQSFRISYLGGNGNDVVLTTLAIPEPGVTGPASLALAALAGTRRRRMT